jgi:RNA polymerase sigma factor (sigma-70 family)
MAVAQPDETSAEATGMQTIEELFGALESPLLTYAVRLVGDRSAAEDLVQESFMKLQADFASVRQPRPWLYRTVHNLARNHQRQSGKVISLDFPAGESRGPTEEFRDPQPLPDEQIAQCERIGLVRLSLANLDARRQELVRLKFHEGLSYQQISSRTGLSVTNVGYLLHHAIKEVAAALMKNGGLP